MLVSLSWPFHTNYWYHIKYFISFNNSLTETIKIKIILCLQQTAYITSQLSSPSWSTNVTHKKAHFFTTNIGEFSEVRSMDHQKKKDKKERASGLGRRTRDRKGESNDSPEILDKGRTHQASLWRGFFKTFCQWSRIIMWVELRASLSLVHAASNDHFHAMHIYVWTSFQLPTDDEPTVESKQLV